MANVGKEQSKRLNITVSSGAGIGTLTNSWDLVRRVRVCPPDETVTYDCYIKDADGFIIFDSTKTGDSLTGTLSMLNEISLGIAKTIEIENASQDGTFVSLLDMH